MTAPFRDETETLRAENARLRAEVAVLRAPKRRWVVARGGWSLLFVCLAAVSLTNLMLLRPHSVRVHLLLLAVKWAMTTALWAAMWVRRVPR